VIAPRYISRIVLKGIATSGGALSLRSSVNRPPERINPASAIERVHLACGRCVPWWEIRDVRLDLPPWSAITLGKGDRFCCRRGVVMWHAQGGSSTPFSEGYRTSRLVTVSV
jgi:hypothetical protein